MSNFRLTRLLNACPWPLQRVLIVPFVLLLVGAVTLIEYDAYRSGQRITAVTAKELLHQASEQVHTHLDQRIQSFQGFFHAHYRLADINDCLSRIDLSSNGAVFIVDRPGTLVATSELDAMIPATDGGQTEPISTVESPNGRIRSVAQRLVQRDGSFGKFAATEQFNWLVNGQREFVQVTPYQDGYGLDWLVAAIPAADFAGKFDHGIRNSIIVGVMIVGVVIASGTVLAKRIAKHFAALNQANQKLAEGDFDQTLSINSGIADVQELATPFNQVAEHWQQLFQHQVEAAATRQSEQRFQEIASTINQFFFVRSAETQQFTYVSPAFETIWRHPVEALYKNPDFWMETIHPDDRPLVQESLARQYSGESVSREYRIIRSDGSVRWISAQIQLVRDEAGHPLRYIGTAADISDRKRAELALQAKTEELDRFFSVALDLLCIANSDGVFLRLNPQWEKTLGYSVSELEGSRFLDYVHPEDVEATLEAISRLSNNEKIENFVNRYRCKDGAYRWIEWRSVPIGSLIYAAARDITQRQQMEADLRRLNERLQELATVDSLTQVANRRQMKLHLPQEWERCQRAKKPITLILLDIDYFKRYNDHYGHPQGDDCLRQVADILQSCVNRPGDLVSRYGGEEFLIVLSETGQPGATHLIEKIRQALAQAQISHGASLIDEKITMSAGVVVITDVADFANPTAAIAEVDRLLYQAKQSRDTYCLRVI
jgi:diguanylate cyclase (GGDEF)-like protein/PAS domain S-box-containing protein